MPTWLGYGNDSYGSSPYGSVWPSAYITKTEDYELLYGYEIKWEQPSRSDRFPLNYEVIVSTETDNEARLLGSSSTVYKFTTRGLVKSNLGATIQSTPGVQISDLGASLGVISPHYEWGKQITLVLEVSDYAGNKLGPVTIIYTLESN